MRSLPPTFLGRNLSTRLHARKPSLVLGRILFPHYVTWGLRDPKCQLLLLFFFFNNDIFSFFFAYGRLSRHWFLSLSVSTYKAFQHMSGFFVFTASRGRIQVGEANLCFLWFNRIPIAWMRVKTSRLLEKKSILTSTNGPFVDGRTTGIEPARGGFTIHCLDPLGYIRPYPRTGFSLYLRSDLSELPYDRYQREAFS